MLRTSCALSYARALHVKVCERSREYHNLTGLALPRIPKRKTYLEIFLEIFRYGWNCCSLWSELFCPVLNGNSFLELFSQYMSHTLLWNLFVQGWVLLMAMIDFYAYTKH